MDVTSGGEGRYSGADYGKDSSEAYSRAKEELIVTSGLLKVKSCV